MATVIRPMTPEDVGLFMPIAELMDEQASEAREASCARLLLRISMDLPLNDHGVILELDDGLVVSHSYHIAHASTRISDVLLPKEWYTEVARAGFIGNSEEA